MNVRKLMGRLNAATVRYDIGRGGVPELTAADIAGALAGVDPFDAAIFCSAWWPDGARLQGDEIVARLRRLLLDEYSRRQHAMQVARLDLHLAEGEWAARRIHSDDDHKALSRLRDAEARAAADAWPVDMARYHLIARAVLVEVSSAGLCEDCEGRGHSLQGSVLAECPKCAGHGTSSQFDRRRAEAIDKDWSSYYKTWRRVYEWLHKIATNAEARAARAIGANLREHQVA